MKFKKRYHWAIQNDESVLTTEIKRLWMGGYTNDYLNYPSGFDSKEEAESKLESWITTHNDYYTRFILLESYSFED